MKNLLIIFVFLFSNLHSFPQSHDEAVSKINEGKLIEAKEILNIIISKNNTDVGALGLRAQVYYFLKDYTNSMNDYNICIKLDPKNSVNYIGRADLKFDLMDYTGAIFDYSKAIELFPNSYKAYYGRAVTKAMLDDYRGCLIDIKKAIELNPKCGASYKAKGIAIYYLGDKNQACLDWSKAGELGEFSAYDLIQKYCN